MPESVSARPTRLYRHQHAYGHMLDGWPVWQVAWLSVRSRAGQLRRVLGGEGQVREST